MSTHPSTVLRRWQAARERSLPNRELLSMNPSVRDEFLAAWWSDERGENARAM